MSGSAYGTTPSALELLVTTVAEVREAYRASGTLSAVLMLMRRRQRRGLLELLNNARLELHNNPHLVAEVIARGAAGAEAAAWSAQADEATKLALRGEAFVAARRTQIAQRLEALRALLESAARGSIEPQEVLDEVSGLLDLFLPPGEREVADLIAQAATAAAGVQAVATEAVAAAGEGREAAIPLRAVADRVLNAAAQALDRMETPSPAPDTAPANAASPAVAPTVAPVPFAPLAAKPAAARFVAEPYVPSAAMPVIAVPGLTTALPVPAEPPLVDRFLERRCAALVGCEVPPLRTNMLLAALARQSGATQCGALHVTCTDEAEAEARERFARSGVGLMLPPLAGGRGAVMQICNRGGCYEPGILAVAAEHYAAASRPLTLVVRVQAHCGVIRDGDTRGFGTLSRYGCLSPACGVLQAVLGGDTAAARGGELARSIDQQQLAAVRATDVRWRALCMAVLQARTQLEQATTEARALARPAWHVLLGAVNLNGLREAMELPVIIRIIDRTGERERGWELALPHDPGAWQLAELPDGLRLTPAVSRTNNGA